MLGLVYIRKLWEMTAAEVADRIGVQRAAISGWEKNNKIPPKRLEELSEVFGGLDAKYFSKQLTEIDKLSIQQFKTIKELDEKQKQYEEITPEEFQTEIRYFSDTRKIITHGYEVEKLSKVIIQELKSVASYSDYDEKNERLKVYSAFVEKEKSRTKRDILKALFRAMDYVDIGQEPENELELGFYRAIRDEMTREKKHYQIMKELGLVSLENDDEQF